MATKFPRGSKCVSMLLLIIAANCAATQLGAQGQVQSASAEKNADVDYTIGPGDVLIVSVLDAPEFGGKVRVGDSGAIQISGVADPVAAEGKTTSEVSEAIHDALVNAKQLRDPHVTTYIDEYHGRNVTVLGAVNKPGVYSLQRKTSALEVISLAGGPLPASGNKVTIIRGPASAEATETAVGSVQILDLSLLANGHAASESIEVRNGDVVSVSAADLIYVVGAVTKPGGFAMTSPTEGVSASQAIALAEGFSPLASVHHAVVVRQSTSAQGRQEIPVDLAKMMTGQQTDVVLAPNDILYVPTSGAKKALKVMGDAAMATVNGIAIYGVGYKIGTSY
jgi:polysaccharide export outer membrane protein